MPRHEAEGVQVLREKNETGAGWEIGGGACVSGMLIDGGRHEAPRRGGEGQGEEDNPFGSFPMIRHNRFPCGTGA